ncbi:MAG: D-alanine--D-alanine ligase, partial [Planctomycetes bacterium]|nr:D-alanine--D-alanine ligase [Planctomycetota bacterium]
FLMEKSTGRFALNEINTLPGFTSISMFPMLMAAAGVDMKQLVNRLVDAALERAKPSAGSA